MVTTPNLSELDNMFLDFIKSRHVRIQERLQKLIDENRIGIDLSTIDLSKREKFENVLREMGVELIQETNAQTYPLTETWIVKRNKVVVGSFKVDEYGILTDL